MYHVDSFHVPLISAFIFPNDECSISPIHYQASSTIIMPSIFGWRACCIFPNALDKRLLSHRPTGQFLPLTRMDDSCSTIIMFCITSQIPRFRISQPPIQLEYTRRRFIGGDYNDATTPLHQCGFDTLPCYDVFYPYSDSSALDLPYTASFVHVPSQSDGIRFEIFKVL